MNMSWEGMHGCNNVVVLLVAVPLASCGASTEALQIQVGQLDAKNLQFIRSAQLCSIPANTLFLSCF